jgi:hypothetical protein
VTPPTAGTDAAVVRRFLHQTVSRLQEMEAEDALDCAVRPGRI